MKRLSSVLQWILIVPGALLFLYLSLPVAHYRGIVIHHSASSTGNRESIYRHHRGRYLLDAAYHMILSNGSTEVPRGFLETTRWYALGLPSLASSNRLCNLTTLQICVVGDFEAHEMPEELQADLAQAVAKLQAHYSIPDDRVHLHRECNATKCPGKNVTLERLSQWKERAANRVDEQVTNQQLAAIRGPYLFGGQLSKPWIGAGLVVGLLVVARRRMRRKRRSG